MIQYGRGSLPATLLTYREAVTLIEGAPPPAEPRLLAGARPWPGAVGAGRGGGEGVRRALATQPNDVSFRLAYFRFFAQQGQWDRADAELAKAGALHNDDTVPWLTLPSGTKFKTADVVGVPGAGCWFEGFRVFTEHQQWDRAEAALAKVGELAPRTWVIRLLAWRVYVDKEQWERAAAQLVKAVEIAPGNTALRLTLFVYHANLGQWDKADAEYARVTAERPGDAHIHFQAGKQYLDRQRHAQAASAYARVTEFDPENSGAWNSLAVCHYRLRQFDKAIEFYTRAINIKDTNAVYWHNRASCYAELQQWKQAVTDCAAAVRFAPPKLNYRRDYAMICLACGQVEKYRQVCADVFKSFEGSPNRQAVDAIVRMPAPWGGTPCPTSQS